MAITQSAFASNSGDAVETLAITLPGTPAVGDTYVVVAGFVHLTTNSASPDWASGSGTGFTTHWNSSTGGGSSRMFIASKKWATGDATSVTVDWNTANSDTGDIYVFAYLLRPSVGNLIEPVGYGVTTGASGGLTNNSGVMSAASSDQVYVVGFAVNDDKTTNFSAWEFNNSGTDFITEDAQLSEGGGSPANWSSGAAASGAIVITSARAVYVDYDDNGDHLQGITRRAGTDSVPCSYRRHRGPQHRLWVGGR